MMLRSIRNEATLRQTTRSDSMVFVVGSCPSAVALAAGLARRVTEGCRILLVMRPPSVTPNLFGSCTIHAEALTALASLFESPETALHLFRQHLGEAGELNSLAKAVARAGDPSPTLRLTHMSTRGAAPLAYSAAPETLRSAIASAIDPNLPLHLVVADCAPAGPSQSNLAFRFADGTVYSMPLTDRMLAIDLGGHLQKVNLAEPFETLVACQMRLVSSTHGDAPSGVGLVARWSDVPSETTTFIAPLTARSAECGWYALSATRLRDARSIGKKLRQLALLTESLAWSLGMVRPMSLSSFSGIAIPIPSTSARPSTDSALPRRIASVAPRRGQPEGDIGDAHRSLAQAVSNICSVLPAEGATFEAVASSFDRSFCTQTEWLSQIPPGTSRPPRAETRHRLRDGGYLDAAPSQWFEFRLERDRSMVPQPSKERPSAC